MSGFPQRSGYAIFARPIAALLLTAAILTLIWNSTAASWRSDDLPGATDEGDRP